MRIRTKLAIAVAVAVVVLAGVVLGGLELFKQQTVNQVHADVADTSNQTAEQVDAIVLQHVDTVRNYATDPQATRPNESKAHLNRFINSTSFYAAQRISANGTMTDFRGDITAQARQQNIGRNLSNRSYVSEILAGEDFYVGDVEESARLNQQIVIVSLPIIGQDNQLHGVLAGAIRLQQGDFFLAAKPLQTDTQTVSVTTVTNGSRLTLLESDEQFSSSITESATVPTTGWTVTVAADSEPLQKRLRNLAVAQALGIILILLVITGLGYWEYSINLRQTERLIDGFERLREGEYDYTMSLAAAEEWEQISAGYNELSAGIKEREREIREREQRLGVLNRVLRHNLQNDMNVILSYAELLPEFSDDPEVENAANKIETMGRELISHGKKARQIETAMESAEEGRMLIELVPLIEEIVAQHRDEFPDVDFRLDLPDAMAVTVISSFEYAIENVIENAIVHNDADDPFVEIAVTESDGTVSIAVADNGPGIPRHEYDVLVQGEETALEHGSGVGLWLAYWVVDKSDGELRFDDNRPRGAVVTIEADAADTTDSAEESDATAEVSD